MKVPAVYFNSLNNCTSRIKSGRVNKDDAQISNNKIDELSGLPYIYPVSFSSIGNSSKLRSLFSYGLPCMYSGIPMIDPKVLTKMLKNQTFSRPAAQVLEVLEPYKESFTGIEAKVLEIIKERAKVNPDKNIQEILKDVEPVYKRRLRKKQAPIFHELTEAAYALPVQYQNQFKKLMCETDKKLNERPIIIPFSSYEFRYKLSKIREDIVKGEDIKAKKVINKLIKESKWLANSTNPKTIENQKQIVNFLDVILKKSVLKNNEQLKNLIEVSKSRLTREEIIIPFSRKAFIYDLAKIINDLPDKKLQEKLITIAQKLPTSQESLSAYVLKTAAEPPDKIGHRLLWPSLASVEHIFPRSCGGADVLSNFGGATTRTNSNRKNIDFLTQLKLHPEARENCQKYLDRLIDLYHEGIFARHNISPKYITDFQKTIYEQSKHTLNLDLSRLNK